MRNAIDPGEYACGECGVFHYRDPEAKTMVDLLDSALADLKEVTTWLQERAKAAGEGAGGEGGADSLDERHEADGGEG